METKLYTRIYGEKGGEKLATRFYGDTVCFCKNFQQNNPIFRYGTVTDGLRQDTVSEWLRRWTRNPLGSAREGSNPSGVVLCAPAFRTLSGER